MKKILILLLILVMVNVGYGADLYVLGTDIVKNKSLNTIQEATITLAMVYERETIMDSDDQGIMTIIDNQPTESWLFKRSDMVKILKKAMEWDNVAKKNNVKNMDDKKIGDIEGIIYNDIINVSYFGYIKREAYFEVEDGVCKVVFENGTGKAYDETYGEMAISISKFEITNIEKWYNLIGDETIPLIKNLIEKDIAEKEKTEALFN